MCHTYCAVLVTILVLLLNKFDLIYHLRHRLASVEGNVTLGVTLSRCVYVSVVKIYTGTA